MEYPSHLHPAQVYGNVLVLRYLPDAKKTSETFRARMRNMSDTLSV